MQQEGSFIFYRQVRQEPPGNAGNGHFQGGFLASLAVFFVSGDFAVVLH